jgi:hypothetical protein
LLFICIFSAFLLAFALFVVRIVLAVSDDDMIQEVDAHQLTGPSDALRQLVVGIARSEVA